MLGEEKSKYFLCFKYFWEILEWNEVKQIPSFSAALISWCATWTFKTYFQMHLPLEPVLEAHLVGIGNCHPRTWKPGHWSLTPTGIAKILPPSWPLNYHPSARVLILQPPPDVSLLLSIPKNTSHHCPLFCSLSAWNVLHCLHILKLSPWKIKPSHFFP